MAVPGPAAGAQAMRGTARSTVPSTAVSAASAWRTRASPPWPRPWFSWANCRTTFSKISGSNTCCPSEKAAGENGAAADLAHLPAMADMAQSPHAGDDRVEHGKKVAAKIILGEKSAPRVLLGGGGGFGLGAAASTRRRNWSNRFQLCNWSSRIGSRFLATRPSDQNG